MARQEASRILLICVEPRSRTQAVASDTKRAHNQTSFARVDRPTKAFHDLMNTMLLANPGAQFERLQMAVAMSRMLPLWRIIEAAPIASCGTADPSSFGDCPFR